jgi:CBS domain-containing protein
MAPSKGSIRCVEAERCEVVTAPALMGEDTVVIIADASENGLAPGERFLQTFRELESWMRHFLKKEENYSYGRMVKDLHKSAAITEAQSEQLATFGYLRNALAHWQTDSDGTAIADPRPNTLAEFQQLASRVMEPVLATRAVGEQTVLTLEIDDPIEDFLVIVREHNYSQVPVMASGDYVGILTVGAIARWLAVKRWQTPDDFRHAPISSVSFRELQDPEFEEHPPSLTAPEAVSAFNAEANAGAIAGIVIIDRKDEDARVVAMIVPWDIPALMRAT